jgi:Putative F0F1-ATPase subunit Ca2+/Mg2+ transporter
MAYLTSLGWLMALPIAMGVLLGRMVDDRCGSGYVWTLTLFSVGVVLAAVEVYLAMCRALHKKDHG